MQATNVQEKVYCDSCSLRFGSSEKRYEFNGMVVHKEPCLERLRRSVVEVQNRITNGLRRTA
jgi:hypothetical protein